MEEERLFMGEGLSFWAHRMRGLIFKCPRIVGNMGLKGDGSRVSGVCVHVCVEVCWLPFLNTRAPSSSEPFPE